MKLQIKRSPARVVWWVMFNGQIIDTAHTKKHAELVVKRLERSVLCPSSVS